MRRSTLLAGLAATAAGVSRPTGSVAAAGDADLIVTARTIHTVDPELPRATAFAVRGERIVYVGDADGARAWQGRRTRTLDLGDATVLPGLIDAHLHFLAVGAVLQEIDLHHVATYEEVVRRTVAFAATSPDRWILGAGWDQNLWPGQAFPTHELLSAALPDRPVVLVRVDGHALLANAAAMRLAGVDARTPDPPGGRVLRDASGAPTGVFVDNAKDLIQHVVPPPTPAQLQRAARAAQAECHRWGLTSIGEPGVDQHGFDAYDALRSENALTMRIHAMIAGSDDALLQRRLAAGPQHLTADGRFAVRAIKLYADGALGSRGAALLAPYSDDPTNRGLILTPPERIDQVAHAALRAGFQVCTHAIGDRANRNVLDAYAAALRDVPTHDHRFRIEHAQVLAPEDIPRFAQLGILPSMQTTHQISDMGWAQERLGPDRVRGAYAWRSLLATGVIIANGTDAPVEVVDTRRTFHAAIARQDEANQPPGGWYPAQRMTRPEALASMTIWAAHAAFLEHEIGSLSVGKYADFTVLDRDWMRVPPEEIMASRILATYSSGRQVYDAATAPQTTGFAPRPGRRGGCGCG
ncbi:MAG TPA: amidohydrolase [Candidatus Sulfotelmatobacter sp.]|nr:amidohydrolase [Candidatus Sulfotelmatobacter sp.]